MSLPLEQQQINHWPISRKVKWSLLFLCALFIAGPGFFAAMRPADGQILDFFKEWAAVKNHVVGIPVYSDQEQALQKHLNAKLTKTDQFFERYNAHPPTANLICFPFVFLNYQDAHLAWNLVSISLLFLILYCIVKELKIKMSVWTTLALIAVLLICDPLLQTLIQGQLNLLLAFLIVAAWRVGKSGNSFGSGICLGLATAIKIYPAYLFLYFLVRKDWRGLAGGVISFTLITLFTALVFGFETYRDYVTVALPVVGGVSNTNNWGNSSLLAFWERLFVQSTPTIQPIADSPLLLTITVWSSWIIITILAWIAIWKTRAEKFSERAYAITIIAMLLMAPTTWHHYFIILIFPIALLLDIYEPYSPKRWIVNLSIAALIISPRIIWIVLIRTQNRVNATSSTPWENGGMVALPWQSLTALSYQCYALLVVIILLWPTQADQNENILETHH